jgi:hypothetical protein
MLTITTKTNVDGLYTDKVEICYGSKAELLVKIAEIKE